jgi:hypothetical protein
MLLIIILWLVISFINCVHNLSLTKINIFPFISPSNAYHFFGSLISLVVLVLVSGSIVENAGYPVGCSHCKIPWNPNCEDTYAWLVNSIASRGYWGRFERYRTISPLCWKGYADRPVIPTAGQYCSYLGCSSMFQL